MERSIANPAIPGIVGAPGAKVTRDTRESKKILQIALYGVYKYFVLALMLAAAAATLLAYSYVWGYIDKKKELLENSKKYETRISQPRQSELWAQIKP